MPESHLCPVSQPVALFEQFIAREPQKMVLKEKIFSLSRDSFEIKLENGTPLLKVNGAWPSLSGRKKVEDMNGNQLFVLREEHMHIHTTYVMDGLSENKMCEVRSSHKFVGSKASSTFTDRYGKEVTLMMGGNWNDRIANIVDEQTGEAVARIVRKRLNARHAFFGQDTYVVTVAPGADMALIAGLCICFDEENSD